MGAVFARPKVLAVICVIALAALGWLALGFMYAGTSPFAARCAERLFAGSAAWDASGFAVVASMWAAMTLAMMLPSAAPMILTYAEIADTAARKGERIVSPFVLAAGYTRSGSALPRSRRWRNSCLHPRGACSMPAWPRRADCSPARSSSPPALYQFSALKHACLTQCQQPFPFFFANWATTPRGVFRLGVKQGLYCLGCCWAMMLLMFAVGVMNVIWMAALGIVMTVEKIGTGKRFTYVVGAALIAGGVAFVVSAFAAHWPVHAI